MQFGATDKSVCSDREVNFPIGANIFRSYSKAFWNKNGSPFEYFRVKYLYFIGRFRFFRTVWIS